MHRKQIDREIGKEKGIEALRGAVAQFNKRLDVPAVHLLIDTFFFVNFSFRIDYINPAS